MSDDKQQPGLGKIIYSVDDEKKVNEGGAGKIDNAEVQEASEESFPASDAPGYAGGSAAECEQDRPR